MTNCSAEELNELAFTLREIVDMAFRVGGGDPFNESVALDDALDQFKTAVEEIK